MTINDWREYFFRIGRCCEFRFLTRARLDAAYAHIQVIFLEVLERLNVSMLRDFYLCSSRAVKNVTISWLATTTSYDLFLMQEF